MGSCASFGSFIATSSEGGENGDGENEDGENVDPEKADGERFLGDTGTINHGNKALRGRTLVSTSSVAAGMRHFFQVILVFCGMVLALSLHFLKMLIRLLGEGCLTQLITIGEALAVIFGVCISVFIRQFAILIAAFLCVGAAYGARKKYEKWQKEEVEEAGDTSRFDRFRRLFSNKHDNVVKKNQGKNENNYVQMEEQPKRRRWWSRA